jgi:glyoxylase-like metal-dependent hydrolase (beta-lactamase superfamily II)
MEALGLSPNDVRWVVMTHLHTDHAGGLHHFPESEILVSGQEFRAAAGMAGRLRGYLPNRWPTWFSPKLVEFEDMATGPFPRCLALTKAGDVILVPTPGHSAGHLSVIVTEPEVNLFFAGDASYTEQLMLDQAVDGVAPKELAARESLKQIAQFVTACPTVYLPSHDPDAERRLETRTAVCVASAPRARVE